MPAELLFETGKAAAADPDQKTHGLQGRGQGRESQRAQRGTHQDGHWQRYDHHEASLEFEATHLPILLCNTKPKVNIHDQAMMRRIVVIPFTNIYTTVDAKTNPYDPGNPQHRLRDNDLEATLKSQEGQEQLLAWLIKGASAWYDQGLGTMPNAISAAFDTYREENDTLTAFLRDQCTIDPGADVNAKQFLDTYNMTAEVKVKQGALKVLMSKHRLEYVKKNGTYRGIKLNPW